MVFPEKLSSRASWRFFFFVALVVASGVVAALRGFDDLPLTPEALLVLQERALVEWLVEQRAQSEIIPAP